MYPRTVEPEPVFFASPAEFEQWLAANHDHETELWVGFHRKATGQPSLTWPQSVDAALIYGWIDGIRKTVDATRFKIRFTPRKPRSNWSAVNIRRVGELTAQGRMQPAGLEAFARRDESRDRQYSFENSPRGLEPGHEREFRENAAAWAFFESQPPGYRRLTIWWIVSARREDTRLRRLRALIADSAAGRRIAALSRPGTAQE
jgi:uncharacterized protein YdeI (YjbR/CyaY-like superfamily)